MSSIISVTAHRARCHRRTCQAWQRLDGSPGVDPPACRTISWCWESRIRPLWTTLLKAESDLGFDASMAAMRPADVLRTTAHIAKRVVDTPSLILEDGSTSLKFSLNWCLAAKNLQVHALFTWLLTADCPIKLITGQPFSLGGLLGNRFSDSPRGSLWNSELQRNRVF